MPEEEILSSLLHTEKLCVCIYEQMI